MAKRGRTNKADLYFLQQGAFIKIGVGKDVERRMQQLQTGNPLKIHLLGIIRDGDYDLESELHTKFSPYRVGKSEWFKPSYKILLYMLVRGILPRINGLFLGHFLVLTVSESLFPRRY